MSIFSAIWSALKWFGKLFTSKAAKDALALVSEFIPQVLPIVKSIKIIVPNVGEAKVSDIINAYNSFHVPIDGIKDNPADFAGHLAQLALTVVRQQLKDTTTPERIINAAIELALVGLKAK